MFIYGDEAYLHVILGVEMPTYVNNSATLSTSNINKNNQDTKLHITGNRYCTYIQNRLEANRAVRHITGGS